ncbi:MAG: hypothetical protein CVU46_05565, partial [Chloroflexi bacterium HGW-Chloroflexi-8]
MIENNIRNIGTQEDDVDSNLQNSKTEKIQFLVNILVKNCQTVKLKEKKRRSKSNLPEHDLMGSDLKKFKLWLSDAHHTFRDTSQQLIPLTFASEWVLDNYYIIRQALQQIEEDMPKSFYKQLPKLTEAALKDLPRIYIIARSILAIQNNLIDPVDLQTIMVQFQDKVSLTMGEIWALPIFLRYYLIESLSQGLVSIIQPLIPPDIPSPIPHLEDLLSANQPSESASESISNSNGIANIILSLRIISEQDWSEFFESVSCLEQTLRKDPAGIYSQMDFKTRDLYRKEIENLAMATGRNENELAEMTLDLARTTRSDKIPTLQNIVNSDPFAKRVKPMIPGSFPDKQENIFSEVPGQHIGDYLLGKGRVVLEQQIGYRPNPIITYKRWIFRNATAFYLSIILMITTLISVLLTLIIRPVEILTSNPQFPGNSPWGLMLAPGNLEIRWIIFIVLALLMLIPVLSIATNLTNWLITLIVPPRILPKLKFKDAIPDSFQTLVVIPAMITTIKDIDSLVHQIELHYLRNFEPGLKFAILSDFGDSDSESLAEDDGLVHYAVSMVEKLNRKYYFPPATLDSTKSSDEEKQYGARLFYILHRKRLWNPSERKWIGWERKRGKLHELNLLLRGNTNLSFTTVTDGINETNFIIEQLQHIRFVITLDTDTILPRGSAVHLAGTLAHPLNQPVFDEKSGRVISGYTILQPRMEIHPKSANHSWFTRFFAGDAGLDLYSLAVSDSYQDLFKEGIYVGKGIYDVDAFMRSVDEHIPENTVLSHDLLEGAMGRAGLVTDITMIEEYPQNYFIQAIRQRRWIRGDWQLLPWLFTPKKHGLTFPIISRWKMFDNLRRSLLAPALLSIIILGIIFLPGFTWFWTAVVMISLSVPLITGLARSSIQILGGETARIAFRPVGWNFMRWILAIAFLPYEAYISIDAALTTLYRIFISHRDLLQWTTAAQTTRVFGLQSRKVVVWQKMGAASALALLLSTVVQLLSSHPQNRVAPALIYASPLLLLWLFSPFIVWWVNHPILDHSKPLSNSQIDILRQVTRRTWGFFERFVGPEDHWLPPDHYQESPIGAIAHRTSPTNIGLLFTSTLAAYDLGYMDQLGLATRLSLTIGTLVQMERYRGHFLNWYDTLTLEPLLPGYISTVDSGNLAASLIVTAQACKTLPDEPIFRWDLWQGYLDTLSNLTETLTDMRKAEFDLQVEEINQKIAAIRDEILQVEIRPDKWYALYLKVSGSFWQDLSHGLVELVEVGRSAFDLKALGKLQEVVTQTERHHLAVRRTIDELVPWIPLIEKTPHQLNEPQFIRIMDDLRANLPYNIAIRQIPEQIEKASQQIVTLRNKLGETSSINNSENSDVIPKNGIEEWLDNLTLALTHANENAHSLTNQFFQIMIKAEQFMDDMDFCFLYHTQRRVFHIGFNLATGLLDQNYYDLLASEARIASIIAIAKGDVPQTHWMHLGRPVTRTEGAYVLLSWSGTMFEYLMPPLFLRSYPGTLLADSSKGAVLHQIAYGKAKGIPWGISESGFFRFDTNQNYQYRAFGVPGLGFKRGLGDDLVIAPYASLMAIAYEPQSVAQNLANLIKYKMIGLYGVYEAIDFTTERLPLNKKSAIVQEYMAHHQGMILMAMGNFFQHDIMVKRMHRDPRIQAIDLILQEQIPLSAPPQDPYAEDVKGIQRMTAVAEEVVPWRIPIQTTIPQ